MDKCVDDLMSQSKMKSKYPDHKERKSHAIAICHNSIMGSKGKGGEKMEKPVTINFYGNYWDEVSSNNENPNEKGGETDSMKKQEEEKAKCPECGKMVAKDKMKAHMAETHPANMRQWRYQTSKQRA